MTKEEMKSRTKGYANRIIRVAEALPKNWVARTLGSQLLRSGTSVGANLIYDLRFTIYALVDKATVAATACV